MNESKMFHRFPEILSDELVLTKITVQDLNELFELCSNEKLYEYSSSSPKKNKAVVYNMITQFERDFNHKKAIYWGIHEKKESSPLLGVIELFNFENSTNQVTIGYMLNERYWGHGYATKAVHMTLDFLFHVADVNRVQALIISENTRSKGVVIRNHFRHEGTLRESMYWENVGVVTVDIFSILKNEFII